MKDQILSIVGALVFCSTAHAAVYKIDCEVNGPNVDKKVYTSILNDSIVFDTDAVPESRQNVRINAETGKEFTSCEPTVKKYPFHALVPRGQFNIELSVLKCGTFRDDNQPVEDASPYLYLHIHAPGEDLWVGHTISEIVEIPVGKFVRRRIEFGNMSDGTKIRTDLGDIGYAQVNCKLTRLAAPAILP